MVSAGRGGYLAVNYGEWTVPVTIPGMGALSAVTPSITQSVPNVTYYEGPASGVSDSMGSFVHTRPGYEPFVWVKSATLRDIERITGAGVSAEGDEPLTLGENVNGYRRSAVVGSDWIRVTRSGASREARGLVF